jgi:hypothetical protein
MVKSGNRLGVDIQYQLFPSDQILTVGLPASTGILLWMVKKSGDDLPVGNSGYFNQTSGTRLILADNIAKVKDRSDMLPTTLAAYSMKSELWLYWDGPTQKISSHMAIP